MGSNQKEETSNRQQMVISSSSTDVINMEANKPEDDEVVDRGNWGGQLEFILTCVGYAVGLGNVWRFPYLVYKNGGGAFLIPYFIMLALVGLPLFYMELAFGQFASLGPLAIWEINPLMKGLGYTMVITNTCIGIYYNVIVAWSIYFFFASMTDILPWETCTNWWNTNRCHTTAEFRNLTNANQTNITIGNDTYALGDLRTPSEDYYYEGVLRMSGGIEEPGEVVWQLALCLLLAWTIVFFVLIKGISSLGKVVYFSSLFPYVLLTIMLIRGATLDGSLDGVIYYLEPDFDKLTDASVWSQAATQIFFSLSACTGGLIAMASYNKFDNNCQRDSILVPIVNCATSFYSGFVIFSVLGFMAKEKGVDVEDVAASGPGLVFVVYPEALTQMPVAPVWSVLFFFMLITLGFSSEFSIMECFFSAFIDEYPDVLRKSKKRAIMFRAFFCFIFFLIGLSMVTHGGFYFFNIFDEFISGFPLLFVGLFESIALQYIYGYKRFAKDIELMLGHKPNIYFSATWLFFIPVILTAVIIFMAIQWEPYILFEGMDQYEYPDWGMGIGWAIVAFCLVFVPLIFIIKCIQGGGIQNIKEMSQPTSAWHPALKKNRTGRYAPVNETPSGGNSAWTSESFEPSPSGNYAYNNQGFEYNMNAMKEHDVSGTNGQATHQKEDAYEGLYSSINDTDQYATIQKNENEYTSSPVTLTTFL